MAGNLSSRYLLLALRSRYQEQGGIMPRRELIQNVFDAALDRMLALYNGGHRVVVSFSAGKGACDTPS